MNGPAILLALLLPVSLVLAASPGGSPPSQGSSATAPPAQATGDELYLEVLAFLRTNDAVIPHMPKAHPVSTVYNREAIVPPQCYTRTEGTFNPCYVCHQDARPGRENVMNDADLQAAYSFSDLGRTNHWRNLFEDRSDRVAAIGDREILDYVAQDNYSELAPRLREAEFQGWIPDLKDLHLGAGAFDDEGFARDGSHWVAFNYKPLPSTFWPANGSTDDVMIRLPLAYRSDAEGRESRDIYKANLAILEAVIKGVEAIGCLPMDEAAVGEDLDGDGKLGQIHRITQVQAYVGGARNEPVVTHIYPRGTEFLHTVRYLGLGPDGETIVSTRMKEVRYMRKWRLYSKPTYARRYQLETFEKEAGHLPGYINLGAHGLDNGSGWSIQGFIENRQGRLRVSTFEENLFCMGCHNSIGSTIDKTFSFPRKVDGATGWTYINLKGMPDAPNRGETRGEIATYLERVGGGSEFRHNDELFRRWFREDGVPDQERLARARDVHDLITPSRRRALQLNKAYRVIVMDQDFIFGRDATVTPPQNVYPHIDNHTTPTLPEARVFSWNLILDWDAAPALKSRQGTAPGGL